MSAKFDKRPTDAERLKVKNKELRYTVCGLNKVMMKTACDNEFLREENRSLKNQLKNLEVPAKQTLQNNVIEHFQKELKDILHWANIHDGSDRQSAVLSALESVSQKWENALLILKGDIQ
ncbi:hypothetical protein BK128_21375 [Viridibacillus sp. FSL H7-0596]|uniref:hypothetical protein n=1 Tax=Viridibacillus sp. FSL H7-0596 TaxID=1928923 RepID=UPI00097005AC|nr:hypothetical protein [Viridibacillus sp. FSL H7-0596]OMC81824.1 hypothetical protein BK128_21375 [Viridibacillus sp. FSL H7-0596]